MRCQVDITDTRTPELGTEETGVETGVMSNDDTPGQQVDDLIGDVRELGGIDHIPCMNAVYVTGSDISPGLH